jgi:hypothetical protein
MTVASMGGPFLIGTTLRGGDRPGWPPDRPVEWATFIGVTSAVALLMLVILIHGLSLHRKLSREAAAAKAAREAAVSSRPPTAGVEP